MSKMEKSKPVQDKVTKKWSHSEGTLDMKERAEVTATDKAPYHKDGEVVSCSPFVAAKMKANGWAK